MGVGRRVLRAFAGLRILRPMETRGAPMARTQARILPVLPFTILTILLAAPLTAGALSPGDVCPDFELPWLTMPGVMTLEETLAIEPVTVLVIWNRDCPHCTEVALEIDRFARAIAPHDAHAMAILFGPDDPAALQLLLEREGVATLHLWDAAGRVAAAYGLGIEHLGVFVIDRSGVLHAAFDHTIGGLADDVLPAVERAAQTARAAPAHRRQPAPEASVPSSWPAIRWDGRLRLLNTEGARKGDVGLYGEELESGALFLFRWDLRLHWSPVRGVEFVPWLRVSNEDEVFLTEGPDKFSNARGTASLHLRHEMAAATVGAYPVTVSPLLLQRWDEEDAPPLGGVSGCSTCGAGASGLTQRSLEILSPEYIFEGATASVTHRWARARGWIAVPRWEESVPLSVDETRATPEARYRRVLQGAALDLGPVGREDPLLGLPRPAGLRLAYLNVDDDRRTLSETDDRRPFAEWDAWGAAALLRVDPLQLLLDTGVELALEAEHVWWRRRLASGFGGWGQPHEEEEVDEEALRAGLRWRVPLAWDRTGGSLLHGVELWGRAHRLRTDPDFEPLYAALSYEPNQEGWRATAGFDLFHSPDRAVERLGMTFFYRGVEDTEEPYPGSGRKSDTIWSLTLNGRPLRQLLVGVHYVRTETDYTEWMEDNLFENDQEGTGYAFDLRWEGWPAVDPLLRVDAIRRDDGRSDPRTIWTGYLSFRVVR
ncbi:MAG: redoxin domain-containing protein [Candidatus Eisenbacteria bacterium]|nr:redoxin domain-containing protein [Candidatus Eisenbacteria bacterium]